MLEQQLRHDIQRARPNDQLNAMGHDMVEHVQTVMDFDVVERVRTTPKHQLMTAQLMYGFQVLARPLNYQP